MRSDTVDQTSAEAIDSADSQATGSEPAPAANRRSTDQVAELPSGTGVLYALMIAGYPVAWALGFAPLLFPVLAVLMVVWLIRYRPLKPPPGTLVFAIFLVFVAASFVQVNSISRIALWMLRAGWYVAAFIAFVYLGRQTSPRARRLIARSMLVLWICTVAGGYAALIVPNLSWPTPVSMALPGSIAADPFVADMVQARVAEIQTFWTGVRLNRPAAPYAYTNAWGSTLAMLTPFMLAALQDRRFGLPRWLGVLLLGAGLVPFYFALNRGAWLTLGLGLGYAALRSAFVQRRPSTLLVIAAAALVGLILAFSTGVADTAISQLQTRSADSNETRLNIYLHTIEHSSSSPIIGYGTPRTNPSNPDGPPLGTHGQFWAIMFAHGWIALAAYVWFFVYGFLRGKGHDPIGHWAKVALFIGLLQIPIYGHLPTQLFIMMGAVTMAAWPHDALGPSWKR